MSFNITDYKFMTKDDDDTDNIILWTIKPERDEDGCYVAEDDHSEMLCEPNDNIKPGQRLSITISIDRK